MPARAGSVYPGFVQLTAFMSMNIDRHIKAHRELYDNLATGEIEKAEITKDLLRRVFRRARSRPPSSIWRPCGSVFQEHRLPHGELDYDGRAGRSAGDPHAPRCSPSKASATTSARSARPLAAQDLCSSLRPYRKRHHMQAGVGHYGVFSGKQLGEPDLSAGEEPDPGSD